MADITIIPGITPPASAPRMTTVGKAAEGPSFLESLQKAVGEVNEAQKTADTKTIELQTGKSSLHETMIAVEKADISFRLLMQVRNKVLEAYKEVLRTQI
ncbi:MAG: flagellar hook-basal body complex protein FliE [Candidatus Deferrimicrobiaceae bacterium]